MLRTEVMVSRWILVPATCLVLGVSPCQGQQPTDSPDPRPEINAASVEAFFDAAFDVQRQAHDLAGTVVSVVHDGDVLFQRGYGWADIDERVPADAERSLFRIASITKTFVWTAIMQLVEQGRLGLDDDVNTHLDFQIPATFDEPIRIRHLLSHTPGFEEIWTGWQAPSVEEIDPLGEALERMLPARVRAPGSHSSYSNYGAALAGYIVERVSGQTWSDYVDEHILDPLGMTSTNTHHPVRDDLRARLARGYRYSSDRFLVTEYAYSHPGPAGMMSSTASDMGRFMLAHLQLGTLEGARILSEETARRMQSPLFAPDPDLDPILHGFYRFDRGGQVVFGHGGDTNQFHSNMVLLPEHGLGVFVSFNSDPGSAARSELTAAFISHFFPTPHLGVSPEPDTTVDLSDFTGRYLPLRSAFANHERIIRLQAARSIRAGNGQLRISRGGGRWIPVGPDRFRSQSGTQTLVFERSADGRVSGAILGSPLNTIRRAAWYESPELIGMATGFIVIVCVLALLGWGYRVVRPTTEERRLPRVEVRVAGVTALLVVGSYVALMFYMDGIVQGMPAGMRVAMWIESLNVGLAVLVAWFAARQWLRAAGARGPRLRYSIVAAALLMNACLAWTFNFVALKP